MCNFVGKHGGTCSKDLGQVKPNYICKNNEITSREATLKYRET